MTSGGISGRSEVPTTETETDKAPAENAASVLTPGTLKRGTPLRSEQLRRERTKSCGSISQFLASNQEAKRKRKEEQTDTCPNDTPSKRTSPTRLRAGEPDVLATSSDPATAVDTVVDKEETPINEMD